VGKKQRPGAEAPYRAGGAHAAGPADEGGLVSEVVRQFADPYSFYRELVQNSIDAGATKIAVRVVDDAADRSV
jgi:molecular chaperone HtpG